MGQFAAQERAYAATMAALCQAVETKDLYTRGHSERVARGSAMIAQEVGMRSSRVEAIRYAGMLHDVGKLGVPTTVLQKSGPLTEEEFAAIQLHPMRGLEIVRDIGFLDEALAGIMHHHERIDGLGYPMGLAGDEIPEFARVIAVADAFDAMTSNRSYRGARSIDDAVADLRKWSGTQFDPVLVEAFVAALSRAGWHQPRTATPQPADGVTAASTTTTRPRRCRSSRAGEGMTERRTRWRVPGGRRWTRASCCLSPAAGMLVVAAVAQTAAAGVVQPHIALAFGALIAFGEVLRLSLPGGRESAPIASAGALAYAVIL